MDMYPYPPGKGEVRWISPSWLQEHLSDDICLLDAQPNVHDYIMGHIPGAAYLNEGIFRSAAAGLPATFVPPEAVQPALRRLGIRIGVPVVVYSAAGVYSRCTAGIGDGLEQTMTAYALLRYGHSPVYILDGGIEGWREEGGKLGKTFPELKESKFQADVREELFLTYEEFKATIVNPDVVLLDARPADSYKGQTMWVKPGHIPGAFSLPWRSLMTQENSRKMKDHAELESILSQFPLDREKTIVIYCGTGREATNEFLFFKYYLGFPRVKIYEGSFTEWSSHPENPTVTGPDPR